MTIPFTDKLRNVFAPVGPLHNKGCWQWHAECMIQKCADEIDRLRLLTRALFRLRSAVTEFLAAEDDEFLQRELQITDTAIRAADVDKNGEPRSERLMAAEELLRPFWIRVASCKNYEGFRCALCDGTDAHSHPRVKCSRCGRVGLQENWPFDCCGV